MAITINVEPQEIQSVYNEVIYVLDSTNKTEEKFQYVVDIYIDGDAVSRIKVQSNPQGFGVVDISKHLKSSVSSDLNTSGTLLFQEAPNSWCNYKIEIFEEYVIESSFTGVSNDPDGKAMYGYASAHNFEVGDFITVSSSTEASYDGVQEVIDVPSTTTVVTTRTFTNDATGSTVVSDNSSDIKAGSKVISDTVYGLNNVMKWSEVNNWDADEQKTGGVSSPLLTNLPVVSTTHAEDRQTINFWVGDGDEVNNIEIYNNEGNRVNIQNLYGGTNDDNQMLSVGVGLFDLLNTTSVWFNAPSIASRLGDDILWYTVQLMDNSNNPASRLFKFNIDREEDCRFKGHNMVYLNRAGSFTSFNFSLADSKTTSVKKTSYIKNYGTLNAAGNYYGWTTSDRGTTRLDTEITEVFTINSNYINETEGNLIEDLIISPEVYHLEIIGPAQRLRAVEVKTSSVKLKQRQTDGLINYTIQFEYSNKETVQS